MAGFALLTDNHVRDSIIQALRRAGWDVMRAVDLFGEKNDDEELLAWAATNGRVLATCDKGLQRIARRWLDQGRPFRTVFWPLERHREMTDGDMSFSATPLQPQIGPALAGSWFATEHAHLVTATADRIPAWHRLAALKKPSGRFTILR